MRVNEFLFLADVWAYMNDEQGKLLRTVLADVCEHGGRNLREGVLARERDGPKEREKRKILLRRGCRTCQLGCGLHCFSALTLTHDAIKMGEGKPAGATGSRMGSISIRAGRRLGRANLNWR